MQCLSLSLSLSLSAEDSHQSGFLSPFSLGCVVGRGRGREREVERDDVSLQGEKSERATIGSIKRQFAISATTRASGIAD